MKIQQVPLSEAKGQIRDGDLVYFDALPSWYSKGIAVAGRSPFSHVGMVYHAGSTPAIIEMDEDEGGHIIGMDKCLKRGRRLTVFRVRCSKLKALQACRHMLRLIDVEYNKPATIRLATMFAPIWRWLRIRRGGLLDTATDDGANGGLGPKHCQEGASWAYRQIGIDFVKMLADWATTPGEASKSPLMEPLFEVVLDKGVKT